MQVRVFVSASLAFALAAYGGPVPMTVITENGHTFRGTFNRANPATFDFSDGHTTCSGRFPLILPPDARGYTLPIACNRGLTGIAIFTDIDSVRRSSGGGGVVRLSNGTAGTFITGSGAAAL